MSQVDSEATTAMPAASTRRRFLSQAAGVVTAGTVLPLATIPPASAAGAPDPIYAMISAHKKLQAKWMDLYDQLDEAEFNAAEEHGRRPIELIHWRNYYIGADEIENRREILLASGKIDQTVVEREYLDAKARYRTQVDAGVSWDERAGLAALREEFDSRTSAERQYAWLLARTKPATPAGAAALIQHVLDDDLSGDEDFWHMTALKTAVAALNSMGAAV